MIATTREAAAAARGQNVRQRADRPSQRRNAERGGTSRIIAPLAGAQLRAAGDDSVTLTFEGHASVTERGYEMWDMFGPYTEVVSAGAFDTSLARADLDVPLVLGHDQLRRIARTTNDTLTLSMDDAGLHVLADLDLADADVAYIAPKLRAKLIDEMSFAFRITSGIWSPDYTEFRIDEVDLHRGDVAIVGYGASPHTDGGLHAPAKAPGGNARARALLDLAIARG